MTEHQYIDISALLVGGDMVALFDGTREAVAPADEDIVDHGPDYPRAFRTGYTVITLMPYGGQLLAHGHVDELGAMECLNRIRILLSSIAPSLTPRDVPTEAYGQGNGTFMVV